jgi:hypothetical protein
MLRFLCLLLLLLLCVFPAGMWWHPSATDAAAGLLPGVLADTLGTSTAAAAAAAAAAADTEDGVLGSAAAGAAGAAGAVGAGQLLQLAAGLRMATDVRRAVFVAIMGSEDCAEACEKLLRLPLKVGGYCLWRCWVAALVLGWLCCCTVLLWLRVAVWPWTSMTSNPAWN